jgi:hypothetical protein
MIVNTNELAMELVNKKLLIFKCYQVDVENIKSPLQWWEKMRTCLQLVFVLEFVFKWLDPKLKQK